MSDDEHSLLFQGDKSRLTQVVRATGNVVEVLCENQRGSRENHIDAVFENQWSSPRKVWNGQSVCLKNCLQSRPNQALQM
jgi:hypothetical protein